MKNIFWGLSLLAAMLLFALPTQAAEPAKQTGHLVVDMPGRHALLFLTDIAPGTQFDGEKIKAELEKQRKQAGVEQIQLVAFLAGQGQKKACLYAHLRQGFFFEEYKEPRDMQIVSELLGYRTNPTDLWHAYSENEVVAEETFKGKTIILVFPCEGVAKDISGKPYVEAHIDGGFKSIRVELSPQDRFLRQLKKGQQIVVQGKPQKFLMQTVFMTGKVVLIIPEKK